MDNTSGTPGTYSDGSPVQVSVPLFSIPVRAYIEEDQPRRRSKRAKRQVETPDFAKMLGRMIKAHGRRVADADPEDLADLLALQAVLDAAIAAAVTGQRDQLGRSWADIATAAGTTRQAAFQRWGKVSA